MIHRHKIGVLGEELVARFLMKQGHEIIGRNFRRSWGELDVISKWKGMVHFVEVKSVSCEILGGKVSSETPVVVRPESDTTGQASGTQKDHFRPEDNVSPEKIKRLRRIIQTYLGNVSDETSWQFDVATVLIDVERKKAKIKLIEDLII